MADRLLHPTSEAAARLGIGRTRFYELLASGEIESVRIGHRRMVPAEALVSYVERLRRLQNADRQEAVTERHTFEDPTA